MRYLPFIIILTACSSTHQPAESITAAQAGDVASTTAGIMQGAAEANPLSWYVLPLKAGVVAASHSFPCEEIAEVEPVTSGLGWMALGNNAAIAAGMSGPMAPAIGVGTLISFLMYRQHNPLQCPAPTAALNTKHFHYKLTKEQIDLFKDK